MVCLSERSPSMPTPTLTDLTALLAICAHRSFRKAADELGVAPSTLSHAIRSLERNLGVRLLNRTTRSVSPTEAGSRLAAQLRPALRDVERALADVDRFRNQPSGTLRINAGASAARVLFAEVVPAFRRAYPEVTLDVVAEGALVDIVDEGFDAGIRLREAVPQDMIAIPLGGEMRFLAVASPAYLERRPAPQSPIDLKHHQCIQFRLRSGRIYRWEFEKHGEEVSIDAPGTLILDSHGLMIEAAVAAMGIAYVPESVAQRYLDNGSVFTVLEDWCPSLPGLYLYYPGHRHVPAALRALIDTIKSTKF